MNPPTEPADPSAGAKATEATAKATAPPAETGDLARFAVAGAAITLGGILAQILRTKIVALTLGNEGVGKVAEVTRIVTLATIPAQIAGGPALTAWIATAERAGDRERLQRGLNASLTVGLTLTGLGGLVAVAIAPLLLPAQDWGFDLRLCVALAAGGVIVSSASQALTTTLTALKAIRAITQYAFISLAVGTSISIAMTLGLQLRGQFLSLLLSSTVVLPFAFLAVRRSPEASFIRPALRWNGEYVRKASEIGSTLVVTLYSRHLVYFAVQEALLQIYGVERGNHYNGDYQASLAIVSIYFDLALSGLFTYFAPRFAAATSPAELAADVDGAIAFSLRIASPVVFAAIAFREPIIHALYSTRFELAISLLGIQFCGDVLRAVCYAHAAPLLYRGKLRAYLVTEGFFVVTSVGSSVALLHAVGPMGAAYAYVLVHIPYLFVVRYALAASCEVRSSARKFAATLGVTACAVAFAYVTTVVPLLRWVSMPVMLVWLWKTRALEPIFARLRPIFAKLW